MMCGIVSIFSYRKVSNIILRKAIESINHRGPDENNIWISDNQSVGLGHVRLNIIDLEGGRQPISNKIEETYIVANGEFYEYESIRSDLQKIGFHFQTKSDSEIALHLYSLYGANCLNHLRGEFAFIIWDERNKLLFAARDRLGIKPLYYSYFNGSLYIASEIKALFAAGVPISWNYKSFFLADSGILPPHKTLFDNIYQIPAGHYLLASSPSDIKTFCYWDFNYPCIDDLQKKRPLEEYTEILYNILDESIRIRLKADVPVAFYLSGGIDSSAILGIAKKYLEKPIQVFTISFDDKNYDEIVFSQKMAEYAGANLNIVHLNQADLAEYFKEAVWHGEMIWQNANTTAKYLLSRALKNAGYKVVLTGEGADELFGGYASFRQDVILNEKKQKDATALQRELIELKLRNQASSGFLISDMSDNENLEICQRTLGFIPSWIRAFSEMHSRSMCLYSDEFGRDFSGCNPYFILLNQFNIKDQLSNREILSQSSYLWTKTFFSNYVLRMEGDGLEMANSIEGRLPFLDHKLIDVVKNLPCRLKIKYTTEKYILRETAKPFITNDIYQRQKYPFLAPPSTLKPNEPLHQLVQDTLRSSIMSFLPFYNKNKVINLLDKLPYMEPNQRIATDCVLMKILSACVLQEKFNVS